VLPRAAAAHRFCKKASKSAWLGDPPPMPTIEVARMLEKPRFRFVETIAALFVPYCPASMS